MHAVGRQNADDDLACFPAPTVTGSGGRIITLSARDGWPMPSTETGPAEAFRTRTVNAKAASGGGGSTGSR